MKVKLEVLGTYFDWVKQSPYLQIEITKQQDNKTVIIVNPLNGTGIYNLTYGDVVELEV